MAVPNWTPISSSMRPPTVVQMSRKHATSQLVMPKEDRGPVSQLEIIVAGNMYGPVRIESGCTVGEWKASLRDGLFGSKILYSERLAFRDKEWGLALNDAALIPLWPSRLHVTGPNSVLLMLEMSLKKKFGQGTSLGNTQHDALAPVPASGYPSLPKPRVSGQVSDRLRQNSTTKPKAVTVTLRHALTGEVLAKRLFQPTDIIADLQQAIVDKAGGPHVLTKFLHRDQLLHGHETQADLGLPQGAAIDVVFRACPIATGSTDATARIWTGGDCSLKLEGHESDVHSVSFSAEKNWILSASADKTVRVWNAEDGECIHIFHAPAPVFSASFSPSGNTIAAGCNLGVLVLWGLQGQHDDKKPEVSTCPDGHELLACMPGLDTIFSRHACDSCGSQIQEPEYIFRCNSCNYDLCKDCCIVPKVILHGHDKQVYSVAWSQDGNILATASADCSAKLWATKSGECTQSLRGHRGIVRAAEVSPDCRQVVTCSWDRTAKIWNAVDGRCTQTLREHSKDVFAAMFSPDGNLIVTASADQTAKIWRVGTPCVCLMTLAGHTDSVVSAAFSLDGRALVTSSADGTGRVWDAATGTCTLTLVGHSSKVTSASFCCG